MTRDHESLLRFLADRAHTPFAWGSGRNDCVSFAAAAIKAQTGKSPLKGLKWKTKKEAAQLLRRKGGLEKAVDRHLTRIAPAMAQRGDIAAVTDDSLGLRLMVVEGATLAGPDTHGITRLPRSAAFAAWSIDPRPSKETPDG